MADSADDLAFVRLLMHQKRWDEALRAIGPLRRAHPGDPAVWGCQAEALRGAGHTVEAFVAAERWAQLAPRSPEARALCEQLAAERALRQARDAEIRRLDAEALSAARRTIPESVRPPRSTGASVDPIGVERRSPRRPSKSGDLGRHGGKSLRSIATVVVVALLLAAVGYTRWRSVLGGGPASGPGLPSLTAQALPSRDLSPSILWVPPEPSPRGQWKFLYEHDGRPVRHDPCHIIHYRVRIGPGPTSGVAFVQEGLRRVSEATGLQFAYDGTTNDVPRRSSGGHRDVDAPVVIAWATPAETDLLDRPDPWMVGEAAGVGGPLMLRTSDGKERLVGGEVVLRPEPDLAPGFGGGASQGNLLLHELAHLVGLDHVDDPNEVMTPTMSHNALDGYGPGDLRGLWLLGASQGCL